MDSQQEVELSDRKSLSFGTEIGIVDKVHGFVSETGLITVEIGSAADIHHTGLMS